ncbi:MAG: hypothetical protein FJW38_27400 [Acidobacteria bacterium]|nr:hypothetical protein [Acidobacteriota bacterium]
MKWLLFTSAICAAQDASLSGTVVNALTGDPIRNVLVVLTGASARESPSVLTDAAGKFAFAAVKPGRYRFTAEKPAFLTWRHGQKSPTAAGTSIELKPDEKRSGETIRLTPGGVVSGRVTDEFGEPAVQAFVALRKWNYSGNRRRLASVGHAVSTDDRGEFRFYGLAPGRYLVHSAMQRSFVPSHLADRYLGTFHPSADRADRAAWIQVPPGGEVRGVEVALRPSRAHSVSGVVTQDGSPAANVNVNMMPIGEDSSDAPIPGFVRDKEGTFRFVSVVAGRYALTATSPAVVGRIVIELNENIESVKLPVGPAPQVSGRIRLEGEGGLDLSKALFSLGSDDGLLSRGARAEADGKFKLEALMPGAYTPYLQGGGDAYLKEVRVAGNPVNGSEINIAGDMELEVIASLNGATLEGVVTNRDGGRLSLPVVVVVPDEQLRFRLSRFHYVNTDSEGRYQMKGVAPGKYRVYAFEEIEQGAWHDADLMKQAKGETVELAERETKSLALTANP